MLEINGQKWSTSYRGGDLGYIRGHYSTWPAGIPADYGNGKITTITNSYAVERGERVRDQLASPSKRLNGTIQRLLMAMQNMAAEAKRNEREFLEWRLSKLRSESKFFGNRQLPKALQLAQIAFKRGQFSVCYNWIMHYKEDLEALRNEVKKPQYQNISHMKKFFDSKMSKFIEKLFTTSEETDYTINYDIDPNWTIDKLITTYISEVVNRSDYSIIGGLVSLEEDMTKKLKDLCTEIGVSTTNFLSSEEDFTKMVKWAGDRLKKTKVAKCDGTTTIKTKISTVAAALEDAIAKGMGAEIAAAAQGISQTDMYTALTGRVRKLVKKSNGQVGAVAMTADMISIGCVNGTYRPYQFADELDEAVAKKSQAQLNGALEKIDEELIKNQDVGFYVQTNIKGYTSRFNLRLKDHGSYRARAAALQNLIKENPLTGKALFPADTLDKFIYLLNNTVENAVFSQPEDKDLLCLYLGVVCAAWMFDDYTQIYNQNIRTHNFGLKRIYIFQSGLQNYTLSDILFEGIRNIQKMIEDHNVVESLVAVDLKPPSFADVAQQYQLAINDNASMMNELRNDSSGQIDENAIQVLLQKRWDTVRNYVAVQGQISIRLSQSKLEKLLSEYEGYLKYSKQ